jgi:hypothetical protein
LRGAAQPSGEHEDPILGAFTDCLDDGESLAATAVPQGLYGAARRYYGSWPQLWRSWGRDEAVLPGVLGEPLDELRSRQLVRHSAAFNLA